MSPSTSLARIALAPISHTTNNVAGHGRRDQIAVRGSRFAVRIVALVRASKPAGVALAWSATGSWELEAGSWELGAGSWKLGAGSWKLEAGSWELEAGN